MATRMKVKQVLSLSIPVDEIIQRKVSSNNNTSGKVTVPKKLVGKDVLVIIQNAN